MPRWVLDALVASIRDSMITRGLKPTEAMHTPLDGEGARQEFFVTVPGTSCRFLITVEDA